MKKSGALLASMAAASATAVTSSSFDLNSKIQTSSKEIASSGNDRNRDRDSSRNSSSPEKFAPRFDGLRFIETLVTAHR